jgi:hypothetical protein
MSDSVESVLMQISSVRTKRTYARGHHGLGMLPLSFSKTILVRDRCVSVFLRSVLHLICAQTADVGTDKRTQKYCTPCSRGKRTMQNFGLVESVSLDANLFFKKRENKEKENKENLLTFLVDGVCFLWRDARRI